MKQRVYLDTSIFSVLVDERAPERQKLTIGFWEARHSLELSTSEVARIEAARTSDQRRREAMIAHVAEVVVHPLTQPMRDLADRYIHEGIFTINASTMPFTWRRPS